MTGYPAGEITVRTTTEHALTIDRAVILIEQQLSPGVKYAAFVPVPRSVLDDGPAMQTFTDHLSDRYLSPWKRPDPAPFPRVRLFTWLPR